MAIQDNDTAVITHAKAVHFRHEYRIGNFPNDGIEGLTFGANKLLYLGLEKDQQGKARIFELQIDDDFWNNQNPALALDSQLLLPTFNDSKNHPINALTYYSNNPTSGFIFAAARNDSQIWVIDTQKHLPTQIIDLTFLAQSLDKRCPDWQVMKNYSIEGMVVDGETIWLVNDPWKVNYKKNAVCKNMLPYYSKMTPLLTNLPINPQWINR